MWQVILGLAGAGLFGALVFFIRRAQSNAVTVDEQNAALQVEADRRAKLEANQLAQAGQHMKDLNAQVSSAGPDDLAAQLRDVTKPGRP